MPRFHSTDLRKGRRSESGRAYLITITTFQRQLLFTDLYAARVVVRSMRHLHENNHLESLCHVVMPDHVHWLMILHDRLTLSRTIHAFKAWTTRSLRAKYRFDAAWQRGFHDRAIRRDEDIRKVARYIVANPLRAGLVEDIRAYPHWDACRLENSEFAD